MMHFSLDNYGDVTPLRTLISHKHNTVRFLLIRGNEKVRFKRNRERGGGGEEEERVSE